MTFLRSDLVELVPCPAPSSPDTAAPLRELPFRKDAWLPDEVDALRGAFAADIALPAIAEQLGRTLAAVSTKVGELGLRRNSSRPWSELEDSHLAQTYGATAVSEIASGLGRTPAAVYARAGFLKLTEGNPPPYTEWEIAQVRAGYARGVAVSQLAVLIGRPVSGIASLAGKLHIAHANAPADWSEAEQQRALALAEAGHRYRRIAADLAAEGFPARKHNAVGQVLRKLGYGRGWGRPWLGEEDDLLRDAYARSASLTPLRTRLGRTPSAISHRVNELGLRGTHGRPNGWRTEPSWTDEEIATLRRDYGRVPTQALADALGRKKSGVYNKAFALGLVHGWMRPFSADEEQAIRIARDGCIALPDLSAALGRDTAVVGKHAARMGIPFSTRPHRVPRGPRRNRPAPTLAAILARPVKVCPEPPVSQPANDPARRLSGTQAQLLKERTGRPLDARKSPRRTIVAMPGVPAVKAAILLAMQQAGLLQTVATSPAIDLLAGRLQD